MSEGSHLLLIGGGHAHVAVLADWIRNGLPCARATLLTPYECLRYSGTVPGWIAGQYQRETGLVDLAALAERAGAQLVLDHCTAIDPEAQRVAAGGGESIAYDCVSIDTGGISRASEALGHDPRLIAVRPINELVDRLEAHPDAKHIAVIGGGAGGVELAFALRNRTRADGESAIVTLVAGKDGLVPNLAKGVRKRVMRELMRQDIGVICDNARIEAGRLMAGDADLEPQDLIVAALGSCAPDWPRKGALDCDAHGFIKVDRHQRALSHPNVFAAGDVATRTDRQVDHSGVHAVHTGPVLAANLRAVLSGREPRQSYTPRPAHLYLLSTGRAEAIASYGPLAAQGRWAAKLKHAIDMRWLASYARLAEGN